MVIDISKEHLHNLVIITLEVINTVSILLVVEFLEFPVNFAALFELFGSYSFVLVFYVIKWLYFYHSCFLS